MNFYQSTVTIPGSPLLESTPQPRFRDKNDDGFLTCDHTLTAEDKVGYNRATTQRTLPYRMQDRYHRGLDNQTYTTIVLENEHLRAEFLPQWGGRLRSLWDKDADRELLSVNPANRISNVALRGAWVAGGIEWNLGHTGHFAFTSDNIFCARVETEQETFLRIYEYEATHRQLMQVDFHLPDGATFLAAHVTLTNLMEEENPLYWWTNTAVPVSPETRVFSGIGEVLYQLHPYETEGGLPGFGRCEMPYQPNLPDVDVSYPWRIPFSVEYFFQNKPTVEAPWEVSVEGDGQGFMERSTQPLRTRKMFAWGNSVGGNHWFDYLALPDQGYYVEVQAGLAPTQNHTVTSQPNEVISFTQCFGPFAGDRQKIDGSWSVAKDYVGEVVESLLPAHAVEMAHQAYLATATLPATQRLHSGSIYGGLENARRAHSNQPLLPSHLDFTVDDASADAWVALLQGGQLADTALPLQYLTDPQWLPRLEAAAQQKDATVATRYHLGVSLIENGQVVHGEEVLRPLALGGDIWARYALGVSAVREGNTAEAIDHLRSAFHGGGKEVDPSFAEELLNALVGNGDFQEAWTIFQEIPQEEQTELMWLSVTAAADALRKDDFLALAFQREYATIREGAPGLSDVWLSYIARKECEVQGTPFTPDAIEYNRPLPRELNFRMFEERPTCPLQK